MSATHVLWLTPPLFSASSFFFNDTATTEIYTLSLHDALPICFVLIEARGHARHEPGLLAEPEPARRTDRRLHVEDRKSTRLNSSHVEISYAVFCLKKKKKKKEDIDFVRKQYADLHPPSHYVIK